MTAPPDAKAAGRRRLAVLTGAAALALIAGVGVGAGADDDGDRAPGGPAATQEARREQEQQAALRQVDRLTLRQRVGQVTISSFSGTAA
ncbi:MAG TPA: hypothetical protein VFY47_12415, partial [Thermoleophilaceae bacterium]|nr:hypothetical protein [Thermoleophilaceae bacterium]